MVFTVSQKHLSGDSNFGMGYFEAISKLIERKVWTPVAHHEFDKHQSYDNDQSVWNIEPCSLLIFRKE